MDPTVELGPLPPKKIRSPHLSWLRVMRGLAAAAMSEAPRWLRVMLV